MKLVFATNNRHKLEEIARLLEGKHEIVSLEEIGCREDIPEEQDTLEGNYPKISPKDTKISYLGTFQPVTKS